MSARVAPEEEEDGQGTTARGHVLRLVRDDKDLVIGCVVFSALLFVIFIFLVAIHDDNVKKTWMEKCVEGYLGKEYKTSLSLCLVEYRG